MSKRNAQRLMGAWVMVGVTVLLCALILYSPSGEVDTFQGEYFFSGVIGCGLGLGMMILSHYTIRSLSPIKRKTLILLLLGFLTGCMLFSISIMALMESIPNYNNYVTISGSIGGIF
ncbi:MAG: hypothetical protein AB1485_09645, partial [Candidatus Thermoplasmatota archaeon]